MVTIKIKVIPRSKKQVVKPERNQWTVWLKALPIDGKANRELILILAKYLKIAQTNIRVVRGTRSKIKTVDIEGITSEELGTKLKIVG